MEIFLRDRIIVPGDAKYLLPYPQRVTSDTIATQPIQNIPPPTEHPPLKKFTHPHSLKIYLYPLLLS